MACGLSTALCQILRPAGFSFPASCVCFQYRWSPNCGIYPPFDDPPQSGYHGEKAPQGQEPPAPPREGDTSDGASAVFGDAEAEDKRSYSNAAPSTTPANNRNTEVHTGRQEKHIEGSNNYREGSSKFYGTAEDAQKLIDKYSGTGIPIGMNKERVDFGVVIGEYVDPKTGKAVKTTVGMIHYSKTGAHIVPARPVY